MTLRTETLCFQDFQAAFPDSIIFLNILVDLEGFVISDVSENGCSYYNTHINGNQETGEMQCHLSWLGQKRRLMWKSALVVSRLDGKLCQTSEYVETRQYLLYVRNSVSCNINVIWVLRDL